MAGTDFINSNTYPQYQNYPSDEVLDKELFGTNQIQNARQNARKVISQLICQIKQDQQSSCDDDIDDIQLKKQQKLQKAPISSSIPRLATLDKVFPITAVEHPLDEEENAEELTDSSLDRAFHQSANITRESHYEAAHHNMKEIVRRQKLIHDLHTEKEKLLDEVTERLKKSENLTWVLAVLCIGSAALAIFGLPFLAPILKIVEGIINAKTQILQIQSNELQGDIEVLRQGREIESKKIESDAHSRQMILNLLHKLTEIELQIAKNRNHTRMN